MGPFGPMGVVGIMVGIRLVDYREAMAAPRKLRWLVGGRTMSAVTSCLWLVVYEAGAGSLIAPRVNGERRRRKTSETGTTSLISPTRPPANTSPRSILPR